MIDHLTGLGWSGEETGAQAIWTDAITNAEAHSVTTGVTTYSDFHLPSFEDMITLTDYSTRYNRTTLPWNIHTITTNVNYNTSSTYGGGSTLYMSMLWTVPRANPNSKTTSGQRQIFFRVHY